MSLTIILLIQALEDQPQFFLMILEIVNKLLEVQLPIQVLVSSFYNFLFGRYKNKQNLSSFAHSDVFTLSSISLSITVKAKFHTKLLSETTTGK